MWQAFAMTQTYSDEELGQSPYCSKGKDNRNYKFIMQRENIKYKVREWWDGWDYFT